MVNLWQSGRDGVQGAFLQPIAGLWAKKATQQTARDRLITEHRELFRGSLGGLDPATARRVTGLALGAVNRRIYSDGGSILPPRC